MYLSLTVNRTVMNCWKNNKDDNDYLYYYLYISTYQSHSVPNKSGDNV